MAAGKQGSASVTVQIDDGPGGTLRTITPYVDSIGGITVKQIQADITAFGDAWKRMTSVGVGEVAPIKIAGKFDDTATVGPHIVFKTPDASVGGSTRTLVIGVGNSNTYTCEVLLESYSVMPKNKDLTQYEANVVPTGTPTGWS